VESVQAVIPVMYEYDIAYKWADNKASVIPLPLITDEIEYNDNIVGEKVIVFHGLNRPGFKGTSLVEESFAKLSQKYGATAEFIIDGKMPYAKYLEFMKSVNIVIDQVRSYSHGLNGLIAMASGKIVLGGSEPESLQYYERPESPAINVLPDVEDVISKISYLIDKKVNFEKMGCDSRNFVVENHDAVMIAKKYLKVYKNTI
jgi:glycosyltransferase involved in cell wall biosynthesis